MPGSYDIEIARSPGSPSDGDYVTVATLSGYGLGEEFNFTDSDVEPGQLYLYRARYVSQGIPAAFSPWSPGVPARAPYPSVPKGIPMGTCAITSAQTSAGIAVERNAGHLVKAVHGWDAISWNGLPVLSRAESQPNRNTPSAVGDEVAAVARLDPTAIFDVRPSGATPRVILSYYRLESTTVVDAAGDVPEYYIHKLVPTFLDSAFTFLYKADEYAFGIGGMRGNTLTLGVDKTQTTPLRAQAGFVGLNFIPFSGASADLAAIGMNALTYATGLYGPTDWVLKINNVVSPDARSFTHTFNRNLAPKDVGDNHLGAACHYAPKSNVQGTANLFWRTLDELKWYFGLPSNTTLPFGVSKNILTGEARLVFTPPLNASGYKNVLEVVYPVASMASLTKEIPEDGAIMQSLTWKPRQDPANGFVDHYILWTTGDSAANLALPSEEIAYVPKQDMYDYNTHPGVTSGVPTTTVWASGANAYLSATNDIYNGLTVQFTSGANAGVQRTITDYVGASRTFTVGVAWGTAPSVGDRFIVIGGAGVI